MEENSVRKETVGISFTVIKRVKITVGISVSIQVQTVALKLIETA